MTSEVLSRVEVALENDDEDPGELSRLAGLHLGLADCERCLSQIQDFKNCTAPSLPFPKWKVKKWEAPLVGRVCPCFSSLPMGHTWSLFFCQKAIEEAMWATPGLGKAEILQDTQSCVVPRPSGEGSDAEPSDRASKKFFCVYVDNLGVLGTSRVNVDEDLGNTNAKESRSGHT